MSFCQTIYHGDNNKHNDIQDKVDQQFLKNEISLTEHRYLF
jgi:hypothetical protein